MKISRALAEKIVRCVGHQKCRAISAGDPEYETVGHAASCRERIEGLGKDDASLKVRLAAVEDRRARYLVDKSRRRAWSKEKWSLAANQGQADGAGLSGASRGDLGARSSEQGVRNEERSN